MISRCVSSFCVMTVLFVGMFGVLQIASGDQRDPTDIRQADPLDKDEFLGQISMAYLQSAFQDRVDEFSGYLDINAVDIRLRGNAGMEIVVQRYYSSNVWNRVDNAGLTRHAASADPGDHLGGCGWQLHMGKIMNPFPTGLDHATLIMPDGSTHPLFNRSGHIGEKITPEGWIYTRAGNLHTVTTTDGMSYEFNADHTGAEYLYHDGSQTPVIQCTRVEDVDGNAFDIVYGHLNNYDSTIQQISFDNSGDNRKVEFTYLSGSNRIDKIRLKNGSTVLQTWDYNYGTSQGLFTQMDATGRQVYPLVEVAPPEGDSWNFSYYSSTTTHGDGKFLLQKLTLASGGAIDYSYGAEAFETGSETCSDYPEFAAVQTRTLRDRNNSVIGTWSYVYSNPGKEDATTTTTVKNGSNATVATLEKVFHGWGPWSPNDSYMWRVGRLKSSTEIEKASGGSNLQITTETTSWEQGDVFSEDSRESSLWSACASNRSMTEISYVKPTTITKVVTRTDSSPDSDYTTTTSDFDNWGNAGLIEETGDINRTTEIEYWQDTAHNIKIGRISARDPDPGGTECIKYTTSGKVSKRFVNPKTDDVSACSSSTPSYARQTTYTYDSDGNLYQEIVENGSQDRQTTYRNYSFGQAESITVENGSSDILYCRNILPLGTIEWETDGRGTSCSSSTYRTSYDYDSLGRLITITPPNTSPQGLPTTFNYLDDWSRVTVTRGDYDIQYTFDGIGRLTEREDLETLHRIVVNYDPFGVRKQLRTYFDTDPVDTFDYDVLGRLLSITHANGDIRSFSFDGSKVTRMDEENHSTQYFYEAFGDPNDRRLATLIDANWETTQYSYDAAFGLLSFVDAPISRGDRQFWYYTNQSNYWNGFLYRENNKETGNIDYEYDRLGNVAKKKRYSPSESTIYSYDKAGRLSGINYPDSSNDVNIEYDQAGHRTLLNSAAGKFDYSYDNAGRLEWKQSSIDVGGLKTYLIEYEYDGMDRVHQITYPSNRLVRYSYDSESRLESVDEPSPSTVDYIDNITYHPSGTPDLTTFANGVTTDIGLDDRFRIHTMQTSLGTTSLMDVSLDYDKVDNVETWTDSRSGGAGVRSFTYDNLDRLLTANASSMWGNLSFTYDELGNRKTRTLAGDTTTYNYSTSNNRLTSLSGAETASYGYDSRGRLTSLEAPDLTPPENVTDLSATPQGAGGTIHVAWINSVSPDVANVSVYRKTTGYPSAIGDGHLVCTLSNGATNCNDTSLSLGRRYFYTVFACDEENNCSAASTSAIADVCPSCDLDLMVGLSTADLKGLRNEGVMGTPPPVWSVNTDWDMLSAPGSNARPALADLDNDGDLDLFVGFADGRYRTWENTSSRQAPEWQSNTFWPPSFDIGSYAAPTLADLDGDGDLDILSGNSYGQLEAYRNTGDAESPGSWEVVADWSDDLPDVGSDAAPVLGDLDGDGLPDLLIGTSTGNCLCYRNTGDGTAPHWTAMPSWNIIPDTNHNDAVPALGDLDGDGDLDALVGDHYGNRCLAYENTGGPISPVWTRESSWDVSISGYYTAPVLGDLDHEWSLGIFADGFESGDTSAWFDSVGKSMESGAWGDAGWDRASDREGPAGNMDTSWGEYNAGRGDSRLRNDTVAESKRIGDPAARPEKNALSDDLFQFVFNAADQMTQANWDFGVLGDYEYDGDNLRIRKTTSSDELVYIRDAGGNVLAEYDGANTLLAEYIYAGGRQVAKVEPSAGGDSFRFFHSDQLGTALVITDDSGAVTWRGEYYPFGEEYSSEGTPNRYRFTEREADQATGLTYMRARYYDPRRGRFISVDPVGGSVGSSQSWNRYSYVLNNPVKLVDLDGKQEVPPMPKPPNPFNVLDRFMGNLPPMAIDPEYIGKSQKAIDLFESFQEFYDASGSPEDGKQIKRTEMKLGKAKKQFDNIAPDAKRVDKTKGAEVWVGKDKKTGRTVIFRTRSTDQGGSAATMEEQRKTSGDKTKSREIRINEPPKTELVD